MGKWMMRIALALGLTLLEWLAMGASPRVDRILQEAQQILERGDISYTYGGKQVGQSGECRDCQNCLAKKAPQPGRRAQVCPACARCSLDCTHFIQEVFSRSGISMAYLTTATMLESSRETLLHRFDFQTIEPQVSRLRPGDILVYRGHAALLEKVHPSGLIDVIHATSGRDLKGPGLGIQRQRQVDPSHLRGPLQRVLRHKDLINVKKPFRPAR